jgi:DNA polymerase III delta prime subunit
MNTFSHHHAFLLKGSREDAEILYNELLKNKDVEASFVFEKNFSIDSARKIKEIASQTTLKSLRYIVIAAYSVGHEAQNALLKTLEELPDSKKIIFFIENYNALLPTFISRFAKEDHKEEEKKDNEDRAYAIGGLLKEVEIICKEIKDEISTKSKASTLLDKLIMYKRTDHEKVKKLLYFKSCIGKPSASVKHILESAVAIAG